MVSARSRCVGRPDFGASGEGKRLMRWRRNHPSAIGKPPEAASWPENHGDWSFEKVVSVAGIETDPPEGVHLGKIG
jgi:hypothetical protein